MKSRQRITGLIGTAALVAGTLSGVLLLGDGSAAATTAGGQAASQASSTRPPLVRGVPDFRGCMLCLKGQR